MNAVEYQDFLDELASTLSADPLVLGLITLGSTADAACRDRRSDHDFWVITSPGAQSDYLDTFDWLPRADGILLAVRHGPSRRTVLYEHRHQVEYAVFAPEEAAGGRIERFQVLIDRQDIGRLAESVRLQTFEERGSALARPDRLENLCLLLWTAHERWERGEHLSSQRYIQLSVDVFLDLLTAHDGLHLSPAADRLDARRRLERLRPEVGRALRLVVGLDPATAGVALLDLAERELKAKAPDLGWGCLLAVREWLREARPLARPARPRR